MRRRHGSPEPHAEELAFREGLGEGLLPPMWEAPSAGDRFADLVGALRAE
jgi:hypothetical protein